MDDNARRRRAIGPIVASLALAALAAVLGQQNALAQTPVDDDGNPVATASPLDGVDIENPMIGGSELLSQVDIDEIIGPVALYPDDLLAVVLPASTYPLQIVQAARFLDRLETDASLEPDDEWDDSVVALLNYPDVLRMMNDDIEWTWRLGEAVVRQQSDVILAIESFRDRAYAAGNLKSDEYQSVSVGDGGIIEIEPVSEDVIYVPYYEPERVVYASPTPVFHYYPQPYPLYYYPYPSYRHFPGGFFWGVTTAFSIGWATDHLHVYHHSYRGHPYFGRHYNFGSRYWRRPSINVYNTWYVNRNSPWYGHRHTRGDYWRPRHRSGARPRTLVTSQGYPRGRDYGDRQPRIRNHGAGYRSPGVRRNVPGQRGRPDANAGRDRGREDLQLRPRGRDGSYSATRRQRVETSARRTDAVRNRARRPAAAAGSDNRRTVTTRRSNRETAGEQRRIRRAAPTTRTQSGQVRGQQRRTAGYARSTQRASRPTAAPQSRRANAAPSAARRAAPTSRARVRAPARQAQAPARSARSVSKAAPPRARANRAERSPRRERRRN